MTLIMPSISTWSIPIFFLRKEDGSLWLCIDYHDINKVTVRSKYPFHGLMIYSINYKNYRSTQWSIWNPSIENQGRWYTENRIQDTFQPLQIHSDIVRAYQCLGGIHRHDELYLQVVLRSVCYGIYLNLLAEWSKIWESSTTSFSSPLREQTLRKLKKCEFWLCKVSFLGHIITQLGIFGELKTMDSVVD